MNVPEHYETDVLFFFDCRPDRLALYQAFFQRLSAAFPEASVKVQKSQISFYGTHLFAMASLPKRKKDPGIVISFGLGRREPSPRIAAAAQPYPDRWTHHTAVTKQEELDDELMGWLKESWDFAQGKRGRRTP